MISDDTDEDADDLDDDQLLETYLSPNGSNQDGQADTVDIPIADWPPARGQVRGLTFNVNTLSWFKANYANWLDQMNFVLRAWVVAHTTTERPISVPEESPLP